MKVIYVIYSIDEDKYVDLIQAYSDKLEALKECDELNNSVERDRGIVYKVSHCGYESYETLYVGE